MSRTVYVANVIGDELIPAPIPVEAAAPVRYGEGADDLFVLYGDLEGITCVLVADDENDAERIIIRTFGDMLTIDDLQESDTQVTPLSESLRQPRVATPARGWMVDDLQSVEPDFLTPRDGITVELAPGLDGMGFNRVAVYGPTREAVVEYVRSEWGDDDAAWFDEWVLHRVEEVTPATELVREGDTIATEQGTVIAQTRHVHMLSGPAATLMNGLAEIGVQLDGPEQYEQLAAALQPPDPAASGYVYMDARFDVTDLTADQRDQLALEIAVQADRSDGHPSVDEPTITFTGPPREAVA